MKHILRLLVLFLVITITANAQQVLLEEEPEDAYKKDKYGVNRSHFFYTYTQVAFFAGNAAPPMVYRPGSGDVAFGVRYKKRISGVLSTGLELQYKYSYVRFPRNTAVPYLDTLFTDVSQKHRKSRLGWNALGLSGYLRFNFDPRRGNYMGYYLEFAGGPEVNILKDFVVHDVQSNGTHVKTRYTRFPFINPLVYNVQARFGFNKIALGASYRIGNVFKETYNLPEPPRIAVTLQLSAFND